MPTTTTPNHIDKSLKDLSNVKSSESIICSNDNSLNIISINNLTKIIATKLKLTANLDNIAYFDNSSKRWQNVYFYCWNNSSGQYNAAWPGSPMTYVKDNIWKAEIPLIGATHIIFNDGKKEGADQTKNFTLFNNHVYNYDSDCGEIPENFLVSDVDILLGT